MLADISVNEAIKTMKSTKCQASISKVLETLDYLEFSCNKPICTHCQKVEFPRRCIINVRGHLIVYFNGVFYDPTLGIMQEYEFKNIIISALL